ncbi:MAG: helix-turn-helix domain-containing protein [Acidimicrobiia bacterium]|nr:helix-turn-helix domain-containing protein [Acidimicrobiia bacterium]
MSTADAAHAIGVTLRALYRLIDEGRLPAYRFGRVIRLRRDDVERFGDGGVLTPCC